MITKPSQCKKKSLMSRGKPPLRIVCGSAWGCIVRPSRETNGRRLGVRLVPNESDPLVQCNLVIDSSQDSWPKVCNGEPKLGFPIRPSSVVPHIQLAPAVLLRSSDVSEHQIKEIGQVENRLYMVYNTKPGASHLLEGFFFNIYRARGVPPPTQTPLRLGLNKWE